MPFPILRPGLWFCTALPPLWAGSGLRLPDSQPGARCPWHRAVLGDYLLTTSIKESQTPRLSTVHIWGHVILCWAWGDCPMPCRVFTSISVLSPRCQRHHPAQRRQPQMPPDAAKCPEGQSPPQSRTTVPEDLLSSNMRGSWAWGSGGGEQPHQMLQSDGPLRGTRPCGRHGPPLHRTEARGGLPSCLWPGPAWQLQPHRNRDLNF